MYSKLATYFRENAKYQPWLKLQELLICIINEKPKHIRIPGLVAGGYTPVDQAVFAATSSLALAYAGIVILDDILDGDQRYDVDVPNLANMAGALFSFSVQELRTMSGDLKVVLQAQSVLSEMYSTVALGQALDVENPDTEEAYWQVARLKSGAFFKGAFLLGGLAGGAPTADLSALGELGEEYGLMLQVHDDLSDALEVPANPDWLNGRFNLPILFVYSVDHPWQERFKQICRRVDRPDLLEEAQNILVRCGALSFGLYQIQEHAEKVKALFTALNGQDLREIEKLFDELVTPAEDLVNLASNSG